MLTHCESLGMKFDTLYKRTKTGAIQYWKVFTAFQEDWGYHAVNIAKATITALNAEAKKEGGK